MKSLVVAYAENQIIGDNGRMPWEGELPADMQHFRNVTRNSTVIMGRKTLESIGRPLPERQNIVLSKSLQGSPVKNLLYAATLEDAYRKAEYEDVNVIGGGEIYQLALPTVDQIQATEIHESFWGDARFDFDRSQWNEVARYDREADEKNKYAHSFVTYVRRHLIPPIE